MDVDGIHAIRYTSMGVINNLILTLTSLEMTGVDPSLIFQISVANDCPPLSLFPEHAIWINRTFQIKWWFLLLESPFLLISFTLHDNQQGENQATPNALCLEISSAKYPGSLIIILLHRIIWPGFRPLITTIAFQSSKFPYELYRSNCTVLYFYLHSVHDNT